MSKSHIPFKGPFPLSKAVISSDKFTMEVSGQIGINPDTKQLEKGIKAQTEQAIAFVKEILSGVGWTLANVTKTRILLVDMADYAKMNEVYAKHFTEPYPARVAYAVQALPAGALVEIECTATGEAPK